MIKSDAVLLAIDAIALTSSKNEKQALVVSHIANGLFKRVCEYAYNPFKTYGIKPSRWADHACGSVQEFDDATWGLLDALIERSLTGNAARSALDQEFERLSAESADLLSRIVRKDLRAGFSESTINKACKGLIPEFPYQRCCLPKDAKLDEFDWQRGAFSQEKADGMFANVNVDGTGFVNITSRQGSPFPMEKFESLEREICAKIYVTTQTHGEILVEKGGVICAREIGNGILNSVLSGGDFDSDERPIFFAWDQIPMSSVVKKGKCLTQYSRRYEELSRQVHSIDDDSYDQVRLIPTRICHSMADAMKHYGEMLAAKKEGTVIKNPSAPWKDGTSKEQVKLKMEVDVDLQVLAIVEGKDGGKNEGRPGSMTCTTSDGLLVVDVTVKNEAMRDAIEDDSSDWIGRIIVVRFNQIMAPSESNDKYSLFLPRMVESGYRTDKTEPDSLASVRAQFEAAMKGEK